MAVNSKKRHWPSLFKRCATRKTQRTKDAAYSVARRVIVLRAEQKHVYSSEMAVKMKDIARELGVSLVTVSKALRNHPDISKATRERIEKRVKELNYRPNLAARSLVTGRSSLIGLIVPDLIHPFFAEVAKGLSLALRERGYYLVLSSSEEDPTLEAQEIEHMLSHRLDALVIASCQLDSEPLRNIQGNDTRIVLIDRSFDDFPCHFVGSDDYSAGRLAATQLINMGCKRIAHVRGPQNNVGNRRCKGFLDAMTKHGISTPGEYVTSARTVDVDGRERGAEALRHLFSLKRPPDGVFCYNDVVAIGVVREATERGLKIPGDLAVIGCGNLHFDEDLRIPLSSIDQRSGEIGARAAKMIIQLLATDAPQDIRKIILQPRLVTRDSAPGLPMQKSKLTASKR